MSKIFGSILLAFSLLLGVYCEEGFTNCQRNRTKTDDILSSEIEKSVILNVRVPKNPQYLKLTVVYQDETEDILHLTSLKATATFKFYNFSRIKIHSENVDFCLNYQLSNYTVPGEEKIDVFRSDFKIAHDQLTRQIRKSPAFDFNKTAMEVILCDQFNVYKKEFGKPFDNCDTKNPNKTVEIIRHGLCPSFWINSADCYQLTFRILVSEKVIPKDIKMDDHMKNALASSKRYLDDQDLTNFWINLVSENALEEFDRGVSSTLTNIMLIVSAIIGILALGFFILVAIFRTPIVFDKFGNDSLDIIENEEQKEDSDYTTEMTCPAQVYGGHNNSAFKFDEERRNKAKRKEIIASQQRHGSMRKISMP